ncbi:MAG: iron dicitrate transport regulator FecR, partial [Polaromonas sp.]|nr:iron dicitrate transport regulator FecR [Polaromonas sp.]
MTQHQLQGRSEKEILWFQRRDTLKAAAAWVAMGGLPAAMAQQRSNVVELIGDALLNGTRLLPGQTIQTGDQIQTGPGARLVFAMGNSSF